MRLSTMVIATAFATSGVSQAETFQMDFGPPGHVEYVGKQFGEPTIVTPTKPGETADNWVLKGVEFKLGDATLSADKVGAFSTDGDAASSSPEALTKSFFFANPNNPDVGAVVEMKLTGVKKTDSVKFEFIRGNQPFDAHVIVTDGTKKLEKDVTTDGEFTEVGTLTGSESYTIQITHLADKPAEADIGGARISITPAGEKPTEKAAAKESDKPAEKAADKPADKPAEKAEAAPEKK